MTPTPLAPESPSADLAHRLRVALDHVSDGVVVLDAQGRILHHNAVAGRLLGLGDAAPAAGWRALLASSGREAVVELPARPTPAIAPRPVEIRSTPVQDALGRADGRVVLLRDLGDARRMAAELAHLATHDELTGLPNRRAFECALAAAVGDARATGATHAMVYVDLDEFKIVNDTCGHAAGDELLFRLAAHLRESLIDRLGPPNEPHIESDDPEAPASERAAGRWLLARLGGDEFGLLLHGCTAAFAALQADRLQDDVQRFRFHWGAQVFRVGTSIGIAAVDRGCAGVDALLQAADGACYMAKDAGRNRIQVHTLDDPELARRADAMQWVSRIESALEEDRFCLFAQPIASLQQGTAALADRARGLHFEVLLRLREEDGGLALPGAFMPAVERYHLAARIDEWVLTHTLHWLSHRAPGEVSHCAINLSAHTVGDPAMLQRIEALLDTWPVPPECLCFEITETAAIGHLAQAEAFMRSLRARGCQVALDDFGVGMSSFAYLRQLPVDVLKIDGLFVRGVERDAVNQSMLRAIRDVARVMGLRTVAEFAESDSTVDWLRAQGLDHAQGYAIARPQPIDQLLLR